MKAIVVAGGTGGHIYPALAIINKIKAEDKDSEILYIGTTDRMEKDLIPKLGIHFIGIEMQGLSRKNILSNVKLLKVYSQAIKKSKQVIKDFDPDIVIGVGGYITVPVIYAAKKLGYKTIIHEQNSIPGLSNKYLSKLVDKVCISLPNSKKYFPKNKVVYTGNPRSEQIYVADKVSKSVLGFINGKKLVIIVMGSLGSSTMTHKLKDLIPQFKDKDYQVLIITGNDYYYEYSNIEVPNNVKLLPFYENLIGLMKDCDLIVSRAGASTIAEITAVSLPSILIPSPYVTHNHQFINAKELEKNGACRILEEKHFTPENLIKEIDYLFSNQEIYDKMKEGSRKLSIVDSASRIYNEIRKLIG